MQKFKQKISTILIIALVFSLLINPFTINTANAATLGSVTLDSNITEWKLDETNGYIYAISETANKLWFIRLDTMQVEKELNIGSGPSDIEIYDNKLYIPLSGATQIAVVDIATTTVESTITTAFNPYRIAIDSDKLFYVEYGQHCYLYEYDLTNGTEKKITVVGDAYTTYYKPDLEADRTNHILYIAESGSSGSNLEAISTIDYSKFSETTYDTGYGFPYPDRRVILDGEDIFYAGTKLDKNNLAIIHGEYPNVTYTKNNYIFDGYSIYDRDKYVKITDLPYYSSLVLMDNSDIIYLFNSDTKTVEKITLDLTLYSTTYSNLGNTLNLGDTNLSYWKYDSSTNYIYGISETSNKLLFINPTSLEVENEIYVGSNPSGIEIYNDKLYIPLSGATKIAVVDIPTKTLEDKIIVSHNPYTIAIDNNKIFYIEYDRKRQIDHTYI